MGRERGVEETGRHIETSRRSRVNPAAWTTTSTGPMRDERVQRLRSVPRIGPVTTAAIVATIDNVQPFRHAQRSVRIGIESEGSERHDHNL